MENRASWTNRDVNGSEWEYLGASKTNCAVLWLSVQGTDVAEAARAVHWIGALQPHLGTKSRVDWGAGSGGEGRDHPTLESNIKNKTPFFEIV